MTTSASPHPASGGSDRSGTEAGPSERARALLRQYRRTARLTQQQLAEAAGVSIGVVRDIEQGRTARLRTRSAARLSRALGLDASAAGELAHLAGGTAAARAAAAPAAPAASGATGRHPGIRLSILGPLTAWRGEAVLDTGPPAQRAVLGLLALSPNQVVHREAVIDALWGDDPPASAVNQVQKYASRIRRGLDPRRSRRDPAGLLASTGTGYRLQVRGVQLDVLEFGEIVRRAASAADADVACALYEQALGLWRGDPLTDVDALRGSAAVTGLAHRRSAAIVALAEVCCEARWYERALPYLQPLAQREPLHERAHALLMIALAGSGRRDAAFMAFVDLRRRLRDELGVDPGAVLADAYDRVLGGDVMLTAGRGRDRGVRFGS